MNSLSGLKEYAWCLTGTMAGLGAGMVSNLIQNGGSLLSRKLYVCRHEAFANFYPLKWINQFREYGVGEGILNEVSFLASNPAFPLIYLAPLFGFLAYNAFINRPFERAQTWKKRLIKYYQPMILPICYPCMTYMGSWGVRRIFDHFAEQRFPIDISGHVFAQMALNTCAVKSLQHLAHVGSSQQIHILSKMAQAWMVTDAIWMYNTAANCHSLVDVVAGLGVSTLVASGVDFLINLEANFWKFSE